MTVMYNDARRLAPGGQHALVFPHRAAPPPVALAEADWCQVLLQPAAPGGELDPAAAVDGLALGQPGCNEAARRVSSNERFCSADRHELRLWQFPE